MNLSTVSLITGCLNGEKFIPRCFDSILTQTYSKIEVIFIDDGSTDNSLEIAETYREKFIKKGYEFLIIPQKNMGFYPQTGIKVASGKYITTLDIDDLLLPQSIQKRAEFLESHPTFSAVRTNGFIVKEDNPDLAPALFFNEPYESINVFEDLLYGKTTNIPATYMVRADILFEYYPDKMVPMNRYTQNLQILLPVTYQRNVGYIDEPLMQYMRHDDAFTADKNDYETTKKQYQSFKEVRRSLLLRMNLLNVETENKLNRTYDTIFLGIAYKFKARNEFNALFKSIAVPNFGERLQHASINNKKIRHFLLRLQNKIGSLK